TRLVAGATSISAGPGREFSCRIEQTFDRNHHPQESHMTATAKAASKLVTRKSDPDAAELADAARKIARDAGLKSAYLVSEARGVLDAFTVTKTRGALAISRGDEKHRVKVADLKSVIAKERGDEQDVKDAAKAMTALSHDLPGTMYGRKTAAF